MSKGPGSRSVRRRPIEPGRRSMRARGNTAAFTIESSYRARLDWDRTPKMRRSFQEVGSREAVQRGTHAFDWSILRSVIIGGSDSKCMGAFRYPAGDYS